MPTLPSQHESAPRAPRHSTRESAEARGYNYRWHKVRSQFLLHHPLCVHCKAEGRTTAANEVDHIKPHKGDYHLFWDSGNWQALCKSCHSRKTALENGEVFRCQP